MQNPFNTLLFENYRNGYAITQVVNVSFNDSRWSDHVFQYLLVSEMHHSDFVKGSWSYN